MIYIGIDWAERLHDVEIQSDTGKSLKQLRVNADVTGLSKLQEAIADLDAEASQVVIGIESGHGGWINALMASGYRVYVVNPLTSARAREGESPGRSKSDRQDAHLLANLVRTRTQDLRPARGHRNVRAHGQRKVRTPRLT